jgi:hypothetical protein
MYFISSWFAGSYSKIPLNWYYSLWNTTGIIANGSGAIILIALQKFYRNFTIFLVVVGARIFVMVLFFNKYSIFI